MYWAELGRYFVQNLLVRAGLKKSSPINWVQTLLTVLQTFRHIRISPYSTNSHHFWVKACCHSAPTAHDFPKEPDPAFASQWWGTSTNVFREVRASKKSWPRPRSSFRIVCFYDARDWTSGLNICQANTLPLSYTPAFLSSAWEMAEKLLDWSFLTNKESQAVSMWMHSHFIQLPITVSHGCLFSWNPQTRLHIYFLQAQLQWSFYLLSY